MSMQLAPMHMHCSPTMLNVVVHVYRMSALHCCSMLLLYPPTSTAMHTHTPTHVASYPGPRAERGRGPGDTWQNSCVL